MSVVKFGQFGGLIYDCLGNEYEGDKIWGTPGTIPPILESFYVLRTEINNTYFCREE